MDNTAQDIVFDYDKANRVEAVSQGTRTVSYQYDPAGNRTRMTWPDGFFVNYGYDAANRMETINEQATTALASYEYNKQYLRKLATLGNGTTSTYRYTNQSRLMTLNHDLTGTENDVILSHNYNQVGQLVSRATSNNLFDWQSNATTKTTYDANGLNQYTTIDGVAQQHDGNGNLEDDGNWMLEFDEENRLVSAANADVNVAYQYDAEGRRLGKAHNGAVKQYLYDGADLIAVYGSAGNLIQRYVHGPGVDEPLVGYDYDSQGTQQAKRWYYANHQGSVIATADAAGDVDQIYTYSSFGVPGEQQAPPQFGYTGQVWDEEAQLAYYKARYYSPERGRFVSTDPAGYVDSMNLYSYVVNDPVNSIDPRGLELYGLSAGFNFNFKLPLIPVPITGGISVTGAIDTDGGSTFLITPEAGVASTKGTSGFARVVIGADATNTVDDLKGRGTSVSGLVGKYSSSLTYPRVDGKLGIAAPIVEFGVGFGKSGASLTEGVGLTPREAGDFLKRGFDYGKQLIDLASSAYSRSNRAPATRKIGPK